MKKQKVNERNKEEEINKEVIKEVNKGMEAEVEQGIDRARSKEGVHVS